MKTDNFQLKNSQEPGAVEDGLWPDPKGTLSDSVRRLASVLVGWRKKNDAARRAGVKWFERPSPKKHLATLPFDERATLYGLQVAIPYLVKETKWPKGIKPAVDLRCRQMRREESRRLRDERIVRAAGKYLSETSSTIYVTALLDEVKRLSRETTNMQHFLALLDQEFGDRLIRRRFDGGLAVKLQR